MGGVYEVGQRAGSKGASNVSARTIGDIRLIGLNNCYKCGTGGEKDFQKALELYLDVAKAHDDYALYALGDMYLKGLGVESDLQKAYDYFQKAARYGSRAAENALNSKKFRDFKK